jgi:hypothetical protein
MECYTVKKTADVGLYVQIIEQQTKSSYASCMLVCPNYRTTNKSFLCIMHVCVSEETTKLFLEAS